VALRGSILTLQHRAFTRSRISEMARAGLLCSPRACLTAYDVCDALALDDVHGVNDAGTNPVIV
jgi:hypothetical protein